MGCETIVHKICGNYTKEEWLDYKRTQEPKGEWERISKLTIKKVKSILFIDNDE